MDTKYKMGLATLAGIAPGCRGGPRAARASEAAGILRRGNRGNEPGGLREGICSESTGAHQVAWWEIPCHRRNRWG